MANSPEKQPVIFLSHGGGPSFFLDAKTIPGLQGMDKDSKAASFLRRFITEVGIKKPKAVLVLSAHWEETVCQVLTNPSPKLYYDYHGFPPETYKLHWPVPGAPDVARRVKDLLVKKRIQCQENNTRGLDHGVFVPLLLIFPNADIPVIELSLLRNQNIAAHLAIAEALVDLRNEDILIIGSGFATHSGSTTGTPAPWALSFKTWLHDVISNPTYTPEERKERLLKCTEQPSFSKAHPSMEHFLPIIMTCAAGGYKSGKIIYSDFALGSLLMDHYLFSS